MGGEKVRQNALWFQKYAYNVTSQFGEDGIIQQALQIIGDNDGWCVEFGASDGVNLSNTYNLINNMGYTGVLIEGDKLRFRSLVEHYRAHRNVTLINTFVGFEQEDCLDTILEKIPGIPANFDLLSIDIDGNDYHVWKAVQRYKPKIVVIEYNPTIPNAVEFVQVPDMRVTHGSSILSICKLAERKGYELIAVTQANAIFVDSLYYELFGIEDNSIAVMREDESNITYIFSGYDGTLFIRGYGRLRWHGIPISEHKIQQLPKFLRTFPQNYSSFQRFCFKLYKYLRKKIDAG